MAPPPPPAGSVAAPLPPGGAAPRLRRPLGGLAADGAYLVVVALVAAAALAGLVYLIWTTVGQTGEIWETFGVWGFITGEEWVPLPVDGPPVFGALPFIYGTLTTSLIAMVIAVPLAVAVALATTVFLPRRVRGPVAAVVDLLAAVPSVVYGLWGVTVLVPAARPALEWIAEHGGGVGLLAGPVISGSYVLAGLVLAVMIMPIIAAISREVLVTVPVEQREAAEALGATRWETVRHSMLPWARSGIVGASALGLGRAVGETIALALLLGNSPNIFGSLLGPGSTLSGVIALEFGEAQGPQLSALTALAVVLFVIAFAINGLARLLVARTARGPGPVRRLVAARWPAGGGVVQAAPPAPPPAPPPASERLPRSDRLPRLSRARRARSAVAEGAILLALALALLPVGFILGKILVAGAPPISLDFFTTLPPAVASDPGGGISSALVGTLIMMGIATGIAAPLGVAAALFVSDVAAGGRGPLRRVGAAVGFIVDVLLGMPSIVVGLTVYLGLVVAMGHFSALAGGIALGIIMFPIVVRAAIEVMRLVPESHREAAIALGAPRWRTALSVVLPAAAPGILTGVMLALARASGETAPLLFTSLSNQFLSTDLLQPIAALPQLIFRNTIEVQTPESLRLAWGATLVLVAIVLILSIAARLIARLTLAREIR